MIEQGTPFMIREVHVDVDKNERYYETEFYEPDTDQPGTLYRRMREEFGRCTGKVYIDGKDGKTHQVGWVFRKRVPYDDNGNKTYLRDVWVDLVRKVDHGKRTIYYFYLDDPSCDSSVNVSAASAPAANISTSTSVPSMLSGC